jgi:predicted transcriptional regulator of viral defense system
MVGTAEYYISHSSAMELHRMVTQPQFTVFTSMPKRLRAQTIHGTEFRFVFVKAEHVFGVGTHWISNQMAVLLPFGQVFREFRRALRQSDLP